MAALDIIQGQSKAITITLKVNGTAVSTSGYTAELRARAPGGDEFLLDLDNSRFTQTSATVKTVTLTKAETLALPLGDIERQIRLTSGTNYVLHKIQIGKVYPTLFES